jgi:hypothetical protein
VQTFRMKKRPEGWPPVGTGPHAAALMLAENSFKPLNCSEQKHPDPSCAGVAYPTLEQLLCSLTFRADHPHAKIPKTACESAPPRGFQQWLDVPSSALEWAWRQLFQGEGSVDHQDL